MKSIITIFIALTYFQAVSQNKCEYAEKTTWKYKGGTEIRTYNKDGNELDFLRLNNSADTTQFWKTVYDTNGRKVRKFTIIDSNPFDYGFIYNDKGNLLARLNRKKFSVDTLWFKKIPMNDYGDPLYDKIKGDKIYEYDSLGNKVKEVFLFNDTISSFIKYQYDSRGNMVRQNRYRNDTIYYSTMQSFDDNDNLIFRVDKLGGTEVMRTENNEYDEENNLIRSYGTQHHTREENEWEMIFERISCP